MFTENKVIQYGIASVLYPIIPLKLFCVKGITGYHSDKKEPPDCRVTLKNPVGFYLNTRALLISLPGAGRECPGTYKPEDEPLSIQMA